MKQNWVNDKKCNYARSLVTITPFLRYNSKLFSIWIISPLFLFKLITCWSTEAFFFTQQSFRTVIWHNILEKLWAPYTYVQGRTGGMEGNPCIENRIPAMRTGFSVWECGHSGILFSLQGMGWQCNVLWKKPTWVFYLLKQLFLNLYKIHCYVYVRCL